MVCATTEYPVDFYPNISFLFFDRKKIKIESIFSSDCPNAILVFLLVYTTSRIVPGHRGSKYDFNFNKYNTYIKKKTPVI